MNQTLMHEIAATRQSDFLREAAHRSLAAKATRRPVSGEGSWSRTRPWRMARSRAQSRLLST